MLQTTEDQRIGVVNSTRLLCIVYLLLSREAGGKKRTKINRKEKRKQERERIRGYKCGMITESLVQRSLQWWGVK